MAQLSVNNQYVVNGKLTVRRYKNENGEIAIEGSLATHLYFEEINQITTLRYGLLGVEVVEEIFGSDDLDIIYNFTAEEIDMVDAMTNLPPATIRKCEEKMYNKDGYIIGSNLDLEDKTNE